MDEAELEGQHLLEQLVQLTGLPSPLVQDELGRVLDSAGRSSQDLTLTQLREALLAYLDQVHQEVSEVAEAAPLK